MESNQNTLKSDHITIFTDTHDISKIKAIISALAQIDGVSKVNLLPSSQLPNCRIKQNMYLIN